MLNSNDWYWAVKDKQDVYGSLRNIYVPVDDPDYVAWLAGHGSVGSPIASEAEIWPYVDSRSLRGLPEWLFDGETFAQPTEGNYTKMQLASYTAVARAEKIQGDITVDGLPFSTGPLMFGALNSAYIYTQSDNGATFSWKLPDGSFVTLNKADTDALLACANKFAQDCYKCEDATLDQIEAGTIADLPAIDAAFAAIPTDFTGLRDTKELNRRHGAKKV